MSDQAAEAEVGALLGEITRQAEEERERILAEARRKVEEIRGRAEEEVRRLEAEADRQLEVRLAVERDRILGRLRMERQARRLAARREALERVFAAAARRIEERMRSGEYRGLLERLIGEALAAIGEEAVLVVARRDEPLARSVADRAGLPVEVRGEGETPATVVAASRDGLRRVDNSLATRLETARRLMEGEVSRILFAGSGEGA